MPFVLPIDFYWDLCFLVFTLPESCKKNRQTYRFFRSAVTSG